MKKSNYVEVAELVELGYKYAEIYILNQYWEIINVERTTRGYIAQLERFGENNERICESMKLWDDQVVWANF